MISTGYYCEITPQPDQNEINVKVSPYLYLLADRRGLFICNAKNCNNVATNKRVVIKKYPIAVVNPDPNFYLVLCCDSCLQKLEPFLLAEDSFILKKGINVFVYERNETC